MTLAQFQFLEIIIFQQVFDISTITSFFTPSGSPSLTILRWSKSIARTIALRTFIRSCFFPQQLLHLLNWYFV